MANAAIKWRAEVACKLCRNAAVKTKGQRLIAKNMQTEKQIRGAIGEQAAVDYLRQNGFMIVERNYRIARSEVDIIALRCDELHFVEVKTRKFGTMIAPEEAINEQKMRAMRRAASAYMAQHHCNLEPCFSLVAIEMVGERVESLRFIEDALQYNW